MTLDLEQVQSQVRGQMPDVIARLRAKATEHATAAPRREAGYSIQNAAGDEAVVRIYDEIWWLGVNALDLTTELDAITAPKIRVEINSPGGDVWDGIAIYNALRNHPAQITTRVDGMAASIASVIAQAGDHRVMVAASQMMIHNAWGMTVGDRADHEDMAAILQQQDEVIAGVYASRAGKDPAHFRALMDAETWFTADTAVAEGLADEVYTPPAKTQDRAPSISSMIAAASAAMDEAVGGVERLVADHPEAESLTEAKRDGLVALRAAASRIDGLLDDTPVVNDEIEAKRVELAKRANSFRAGVPAHLLA